MEIIPLKGKKLIDDKMLVALRSFKAEKSIYCKVCDNKKMFLSFRFRIFIFHSFVYIDNLLQVPCGVFIITKCGIIIMVIEITLQRLRVYFLFENLIAADLYRQMIIKQNPAARTLKASLSALTMILYVILHVSASRPSSANMELRLMRP